MKIGSNGRGVHEEKKAVRVDGECKMRKEAAVESEKHGMKSEARKVAGVLSEKHSAVV